MEQSNCVRLGRGYKNPPERFQRLAIKRGVMQKQKPAQGIGGMQGFVCGEWRRRMRKRREQRFVPRKREIDPQEL